MRRLKKTISLEEVIQEKINEIQTYESDILSLTNNITEVEARKILAMFISNQVRFDSYDLYEYLIYIRNK